MPICVCIKIMWIMAIITLISAIPYHAALLPLAVLFDMAVGVFLFIIHISIFVGAPSALFNQKEEGNRRGGFLE